MRNDTLIILIAIGVLGFLLLRRKPIVTQNVVAEQPVMEQFGECVQPMFSARLNCYDGQFMLPVNETKIIVFGEESCEVMKFQKMLNTIDSTSVLAVDGSFGCNTLKKAQSILNTNNDEFTINQLMNI